ncbi:hypothetical protein N3K66_001659 [Trichothecium roseum]|uniref:Uncharacterized protein n=1 Tax=Trichothecium roseum TaxID=47278 RepID=A0ACC0V7D0_9HYPO|nr:hypothetical protein N3K66_001659 [Trichothecium roseum]
MVAFETVKQSNSQLPKLAPGLVAVFVGATSGIGLESMRYLARHTAAPRIYSVSRAQTAEKHRGVLASLREANPAGSYNLVEADFSLLSEVDKIARAVGEKETKVDVLYMSAGFLPFEGRFDTAEGLEPSMTTRYYSRQLLLEKLLPLLNSEDAPSPRVVSVLAGGQEAPLNEDDLDLREKSNWSFWNASVHSATMLTLSLERVARENPRLSIVHWFPGPVSTPGLTRAGNFGMTLPDPMSAEESGQRGVFHATSDMYARHGSLVPSVSGELPGAVAGVAKTTAGGIWLLDPRGEGTDNEKVLAEMRKDGLPDRVWEFTRGIFASAITTTTST